MFISLTAIWVCFYLFQLNTRIKNNSTPVTDTLKYYKLSYIISFWSTKLPLPCALTSAWFCPLTPHRESTHKIQVRAERGNVLLGLVFQNISWQIQYIEFTIALSFTTCLHIDCKRKYYSYWRNTKIASDEWLYVYEYRYPMWLWVSINIILHIITITIKAAVRCLYHALICVAVNYCRR